MSRLLRLIVLGLLLGAPAAVYTAACQATGPVAQEEQKKEVTVYITRTGKKYHRDGCRYLRKSRIPISLKQAKARCYTPCKVCNPPR